MGWPKCYFFVLFFMALSGYTQNDKFIDSLAALNKKTTVDTQKIEILRTAATHLHQSGNYGEAIIYYQNIINKYRKQFPLKALDCKNEIAFEYIFSEDFAKAEEVLTDALEEC